MQESTESRLTGLEHTLYDMHARLQRSEDNSQILHVRNQLVMDAMSRVLQVNMPLKIWLCFDTDLIQLNHDMARAVLSVPNLDGPVQRDRKHLKRGC